MTRIAKAPDERRSELITTAQQLFYTKGYERTSVSDIVKAVGVAQGTFYYYFDSKTAVLEAIVQEAVRQSQMMLHTIVADDTLTAIPKWRRAMQATGNWKITRKEELLEIYRLIMREDNILLQHKLQAQVSKMTARELATIIAQGVEEGVFTTQLIQASAEIVVAIIASFSQTVGELLLDPNPYDDPAALVRQKRTAAQTAIERTLGAPPGSLPIIEEETLMAWFAD